MKSSVSPYLSIAGQRYVHFVPVAEMHMAKAQKKLRLKDCHQELWEMLVLSSGVAGPIQGEIVRVSGKIRWDSDFKKAAVADKY